VSLPAPNLDDRTFQEIVDDVKRQIGRRCPEWTDHNVSDPGVTLIELFASMTEMMLYRLNRVPEKNYIKFLEMIGVSLEPPAPAQTDLRFRLSRNIEDSEGEEAYERTLRARETVAATIRTENEEAVEFATDADLRLVRPRLAFVTAVPAAEMNLESELLPGARDFVPGSAAFPVFSPVPQDGDALCLGFEADVSGNLVELEVECVRSAAVGLDEDYPAQSWEVWNGVENRWDPLEVPRETTFGFNRPPGQFKRDMPTGFVELAMPHGLLKRQLGGRQAYWVRCRYTPDLPPRGPEQRRPEPYQKPPEFLSIVARVTGGTAPASNCTTVTFKDLGQSDGTPGQVFSLGQAPILDRRPGETLLVGDQGTPHDEWQEWAEVTDFSESNADDRHFGCDAFAGEILFGPSVVQPDGSVRQYGAVPPKGKSLVFAAYRYGGGTRGNVAAGQVSVLKSSIPYIAEVWNPRRADGGREQETLERAKMRGRAILRLRDRAVTAEDYEFLARRASSGVGRARCVQPRALHAAQSDGQRIPPGLVRVLIVPSLGEVVTVPRPADLRVPPRVRQDVEEYLDERRLLTAVLEVGEPEYVYVSTDIKLVADPKADADQVARAVRTRLETYLHPLRGGPHGEGWPFRRTLTLADIYAQVQAASGVAFLLDARIYVSRLANAAEGLLTREQQVSNAEGVRLGEAEMLCTREHRIRVVPMWAVGLQEA
jgi:predicted phage baseplate assembly protein